jgi:hypothetical protein
MTIFRSAQEEHHMDDDDKQPFDLDSPQAIREMNERQARLGRLAQEIALAGLAELRRKLQQGQPLNLSAGDAEDLLKVGLRMERAARGLREPGERHSLPEGNLPKKPN